MGNKWMEHSLGIAPQMSGFGTVATTDFKYILGEKPKLQFATKKTELELMTGQVGAAPEVLIGARSGTISITMPLEGLKELYDPTAEDPGDTGVIPHWFVLLANTVGSYISNVATAAGFWKGDHVSCSGYTAGGVTSGTLIAPWEVVVDNGGIAAGLKVGQALVSAASATSTTPRFGFVKTKAGTTLTYFEEPANPVNNGTDNVYGSATAWMSAEHGSQLPLTMRYVGENTKFGYVLQDCVCSGWKLTWNAGEVPTLEISWKFFDFTMDKTIGGLQIPADFTRIPQIVGDDNGRCTINGTDTLGLTGCSLEYSCEVVEWGGHSAAQGIASVSYKKPRIKLSVVIPHDSDDLVYDAAGSAGNIGSHQWQSKLERGVSISVGVYVGSKIGRLFGFLVPAGMLDDGPQLADVNGANAYNLTMMAGSYSGDTSDQVGETAATCPIDSLFRAFIA